MAHSPYDPKNPQSDSGDPTAATPTSGPAPTEPDTNPRPVEQAAKSEPSIGRQEETRGNLPSGAAPPVDDLAEHRRGARGTAAMDPSTRREVARKGGIAVSKNKNHMAEIGRKGGQSVSKNREHMARIGRKGGAASRGGH